MIKQSKMNRTLLIILIVIVGLAFNAVLATTVNAAAKKTVYVLTKEKTTSYYGDPSYTYKYSYDKRGFLKTVKYHDTDKYSYKGNFSYNKKKHAVNQTYKVYKHGTSYSTRYVKYKYTKKGYLKSARSYIKESPNYYSLNTAWYFTWNKKGRITRDHLYWEDDGEDSKEIYKYNKKGNYIGGHGYDNNGDYFQYVCKYPTKDTRVITEYGYYDEPQEDGEEKYVRKVIKQKYKHGDIVSEIVYDEEDCSSKEEKTNYTYKKIKVNKKDYAKIVRQQRFLEYLIDY